MVVGCEECAGLDWDVASGQLMFAFIIWVALFCVALGIWLVTATSSSWEEMKARLATKYAKLRGSYFYSVLNLLFRVLQCISFVSRASTRTAPPAFVVIELVACAVLCVEMFFALTVKSFTGIVSCLRFSFTALLADSLVIASVVSMAFIGTGEGGETTSWFSFSFVAAARLAEYWYRCLDNRGEDVPEALELQVEIISVTVYTISMIFFAAMCMMTLENLDDPAWLEEYSRDDWTTVSSVYYVLVTISTVGYGDLTPKTGLGRLYAVLVIFGGISSFFVAVAKVLRIMSQRQTGRGSFHPGTRIRHIVVGGSPRVQMTKDFILELFHPDHAEEADDLHVVLLLPPHSGTMEGIVHFCRQKQNVLIANRVHVFVGSVLNDHDLSRVSLSMAMACFVLPDLHCGDPAREDADNIIRLMAMLHYAPHARTILLLMKDEHQQLLYEAMGQDAAVHSDITCLTIDQFKLNMAGKSCLVPGFATLISNLCKTIDSSEISESDQDLMAWQRNYLRGLGNELYEITLSNTYALRQAMFCEVVIDVLQQTEGAVYLIGLVEVDRHGSRVLVNPGPTYLVKRADSGVATRGIFIAPEREAINQCEGGQVFLGRKAIEDREAVLGLASKERPPSQRETSARKEYEQRHLVPEDQHDLKLALRQQGIHHNHTERAKDIVRLARQHAKSSHPPRPPLKVLAKGGHVLFLCVGEPDNDELRLGLQHFVRPLRGHHLYHPPPVVVLGSAIPRDWSQVVQYKDVYFLHGSPSNLFDLERAAFRCASVIFICDVGSSAHAMMSVEPWMADSQVVFCTRMVESQLPPHSETRVIVSLDVDGNHGFVPLPGVGESGRPSQRRRMQSHVSLSDEGRLSSSHSLLSKPSAIWGLPVPWRSFRLFGHSPVEDEVANTATKEYYRQPRFACGQLVISSVVTSLVANVFYNPSLSHLVTAMVDSNVVMETVPPEWAGKSYFEYFDDLLWNKALLPIAIYRVVVSRGRLEKQTTAHALVGLGHDDVENNKGNRRSFRPQVKKEDTGEKWSYLWVAPQAKEATMISGDRVICFSVSANINKGGSRRGSQQASVGSQFGGARMAGAEDQSLVPRHSGRPGLSHEASALPFMDVTASAVTRSS
mmetsp:Transcript_23393/g.53987  ORF Transcript_23393/g.53987 Transcript_23393/m.53987 type:complete len:1116 (+) Transcript_23393:63-3410(+)